MKHATRSALLAIHTCLVTPLLVSTGNAQFSAPEAEVKLSCVEGEEPYALCYRDGADGYINSPVDTDIFVFFGRAGDQVHLSLRSANGMDPVVSVLDPQGQLVVPPFSCSYVCSIDKDFTLPGTGVFTLLIHDNGFDETGPYTLNLERMLPNVPVPSMGYGTSETLVVNYTADHDFVSFEGEQGTLVSLALNSPNGMDPKISVWSPSGQEFYTAGCNYVCSIASPNLVLPETGTYLIEFWDAGHDETGTVSLSLTCLLANCPGPRPDMDLGSVYCTSNPNSTGKVATLSARGDPDPAANHFSLAVADVPPGKLGIFFFGANKKAATPFFQGNKCILSPTARLPLSMACSNGDARHSPDLTALSKGYAFLPGSTWNFQFWYRDKNPNATSNLSDALEVTF